MMLLPVDRLEIRERYYVPSQRIELYPVDSLAKGARSHLRLEAVIRVELEPSRCARLSDRNGEDLADLLRREFGTDTSAHCGEPSE